MKYENVITLLQIGVSGLLWGWLLKILKVSGTPYTWSYLLPEILMYIACYLTSYLIVALYLSSFRKDLNFSLNYLWSILGTGIIGSFFFAVYSLIQNIKRDWWYISDHPNDLFRRHISFSIEFFMIFVILFLTVNFILAAPVKLFDVLLGRNKTKLT